MQVASALAALKPRKVIPIVPYSVKGRYRSIKTALLVVAYAVYFLLPWLTWHGNKRVGQPLLIDLHALRVNFFDLVIFPHDLIILVGILILGVVLMFMTATLYGRVFCGFFCIQTLWTDAFRWIERAVQGEAQARIRLQKQPWTLNKVVKVGLTHLLWLALSFATALTFALYFLDAPVLFARIFAGTAPMAAYVTVIALTAATYIAAGLAREQICRVACPYGKFQTAMQDAHTVTVFYDRSRGERQLGRTAPKAELKTAGERAAQGYGDCVDCSYCVNVCPTGVDIRKGFQIDCIACGLCVDACDTIMDRLQLPHGLIRFSSDAAAAGNRRRINPKAWGYSAVLAGMLGFVFYTAGTLTPFDATVQHQAQPLMIRLANGDIKNRYVVRITNKTAQPAEYELRAEGMLPGTLGGGNVWTVPAGKTYTQLVNVVLPEEAARNTRLVRLVLMQRGRPHDAKTMEISYYSGLAAKF
jgi:cytochrome c oxidase accessory protein FixG